MLYNPQWKRETVGDLISWLETKPPEQGYNFPDCGSCLIAQWMDGVARVYWSREIQDIYSGWDSHHIANGDGNSASWTFGQALARARAAQAV